MVILVKTAAWTFALLVALVATTRAATVSGTVFLDRDGDGLFGAKDTPLAGVVVAWERAVFTTTDANGAYSLVVPDGAGIVWASVPEAGRPGPVWSTLTARGDVLADLAIVPAAPSSGTFVLAADSHMDGVAPVWTSADMALALDQAVATVAPPAFVTVVGDVTQANQPADFAAVADALRGLTVPFVPVPGNHDWYDGGAAYRATYGPDCYSFSIPGAHIVVWNSNLTPDEARAFIAADLATVDRSRIVIALGHIPPTDDVAAAMHEAGVDYLFSGHWHVNRMIPRGGLVELGTEPLVMGGIDLLPAGYRVVSIDHQALAIDHHTFVDEPVLAIAWPPSEICVPPDPRVVISAELGSALREVHASIDGTDYPLLPAGGWAWQGDVSVGYGVHTITASARGDDGVLAKVVRTFEVCDRTGAPLDVTLGSAWPQIQGDAAHHGAAPGELTFPLVHAWTTAIGGHSHQAPPVTDGRFVYVTATDLADGKTGGVVALDLATGAVRWRVVTAVPVRGAPGVEAGIVVFSQTDGAVRAVDASTGEPRWSVDLHDGIDSTESSLWAAPAIYGGFVYVGTQRRLVSIELATGVVEWSVDPSPTGTWLASFSSVGVTEDVVIGTFERGSGVIAYARITGAELWRLGFADALAVNASIVIGDRIAYVGDGRGRVLAIDIASGVILWRTAVVDGDPEWGYTIAGTPAYADGRLFVPTQWNRLVALDAATGVELWDHAATPGVLRTVHYRGAQPGYQGAPVVAGTTVWFADTAGELVGADVATGMTRWTMSLGVASLSGMAISGDALLVPTFDGVVHALIPPPVWPPSGCCGVGSARPGELVLVLLVVARLRRRRRARRLMPATAAGS
jgi:outer membrane protein assembly factor BamB